MVIDLQRGLAAHYCARRTGSTRPARFDHELLSHRHGEPRTATPRTRLGCPVTPLPLIAGIAAPIRQDDRLRASFSEEREVGRQVGAQPGSHGAGRRGGVPRASGPPPAGRTSAGPSRRPPAASLGCGAARDALHRRERRHPHLDAAAAAPASRGRRPAHASTPAGTGATAAVRRRSTDRARSSVCTVSSMQRVRRKSTHRIGPRRAATTGLPCDVRRSAASACAADASSARQHRARRDAQLARALRRSPPHRRHRSRGSRRAAAAVRRRWRRPPPQIESATRPR